jgi:hypothetical protein
MCFDIVVPRTMQSQFITPIHTVVPRTMQSLNSSHKLHALKCEHKFNRYEYSVMMAVRKCRNMRQIVSLPRSHFSARGVGLIN